MKHKDKAVVLKDLGEGLILRRTTLADARAVADFNLGIHLEDGQPDEGIFAWTRDLFRGNHPTFRPDDFTVVEDTRAGKLVSACNLISQTWSYAGIEFGVGRPELVGTLPEYRRRGLVREQFQILHQWSAERGHKVQAITGIPWYYRQFGYEMTLALDTGRGGYIPQNVPPLKKGQADPYRTRAATEADLPWIAQLYESGGKRWLVNAQRDQAMWQYELRGRSAKSVQNLPLRVVETPQGEPVGFFAHGNRIHYGTINIACYELIPGLSWLAVTPTVLRALQALGERFARRDGKELQEFVFWLGPEHPVYDAIPNHLPRARGAYAWFVRVPDLRDFLETIAPVLERRVAHSPLAGHSGELKISFYRNGLKLLFEQGCLRRVETWSPTPVEGGDCAFPDLTFLHLLFGHRTLADLRYIFADCWANETAQVLLNALFPKQASNVWGIG